MEINKRERHFEFNVQAHEEVSALCRDNDMANLAELYQGGSSATVKNIIAMAIIMNRAYEDHLKYEDPSHEVVYLKEDDFRFMSFQAVMSLEKVLSNVMTTGQEITVETEPISAKSSKNAKQAKA